MTKPIAIVLILASLAACGRTPEPRVSQAETLAREQAELHTLLNKVQQQQQQQQQQQLPAAPKRP